MKVNDNHGTRCLPGLSKLVGVLAELLAGVLLVFFCTSTAMLEEAPWHLLITAASLGASGMVFHVLGQIADDVSAMRLAASQAEEQ